MQLDSTFPWSQGLSWSHVVLPSETVWQYFHGTPQPNLLILHIQPIFSWVCSHVECPLQPYEELVRTPVQKTDKGILNCTQGTMIRWLDLVI